MKIFSRIYSDAKSFVKQVLSGSSDISSKRFAGFLAFAVAIILAFLGFPEAIIDSFLIFAASCWSLTTVEKFKNT